MKELRKIKEDFMEGISMDFPISSAKDIMTKGTLALLALSITTGAMASTLPNQTELKNSVEISSVETLNSHFIDCHDHKHEVIHVNDVLNGNKSTQNQNYPEGADSGIQVKNPEHLLELTPDNFKDIISNGKSGVYKHPFVEGEVATFIFDNDSRENPFAHVSQQLMDLGLDREGFATEYRDLGVYHAAKEHIFQEQPHSSHSQFVHDHYDDPNYSKIFTGKAGKTGQFDDDAYIDILSTMIHEAGHSLKHQQSSGWNKIFNGYEAGIRSETSSFTVEGLMGYQFAKKANLEEVFMDGFNFSGMTGHQILKSEGSSDTHLHSPASAFLTEILNENPDMVMEMTPNDIVEIADVISNESINYDFKSELKGKYEEDASEMHQIIKSYDKASKSTPDKFSKYESIIETHYDKIDQTERLSKKQEDIIKANEAINFLNNTDAVDLDFESFKELFVNEKMEDAIGSSKTLKLTDKDINHNIAEVSLDGFVSKVKNNEKVSEIMKRISNDLSSSHEIDNSVPRIDEMEDGLLKDLSSEMDQVKTKEDITKTAKNSNKFKM